MTDIVNTQQAEAWNGYEGEHWAGHHDRYDAVNGGFNDVLLDAAAIGPRDLVLDIGCGNGQVTRSQRGGPGSAARRAWTYPGRCSPAPARSPRSRTSRT